MPINMSRFLIQFQSLSNTQKRVEIYLLKSQNSFILLTRTMEYYHHSINKMAMFMVILVLAIDVTMVLGQGTRVGFYSSTCPRAESIVQSTVRAHFQSDPTVAPGILRMHFHDCFVLGCDGSILIEGSDAERTAIPNRNLKGFDVIEDAKTQIEAICPGVVSCADILALAARDSVVAVRISPPLSYIFYASYYLYTRTNI